MRANLASIAVLLVIACASAPLPNGSRLTWPPATVAAPGEVAWQGEIEALRPRGVGGFLRTLAGAGKTDQRWRLAQPVDVAVQGERVYVVDTALGVVLACKRDGTAAVRLHLPPDFSPIAVAAVKQGVLVADRSGGAVHAFAPDGSPQGEVVRSGMVERCGGLAICADGDIILTDAKAGEVVRVTAQGVEVARTGRAGTEAGDFNLPTAVVEAGDGTIWVLDTFNFRVQHLTHDLRPIGGFGEHGDGTGQFALPKGLTIDPDGHLYLSDARFDVVQVFDEEGKLLLVVGRHGTGDGEFWNPAGLACDENGEIAVADTSNRRVQLLRYQRREGPR